VHGRAVLREKWENMRREFINIPDETVDVMHAKWVLEEMR
jgi:hypothetical protein